MAPDRPSDASDLGRGGELYLALLKGCLTRTAFPERWEPHRPRSRLRRLLLRMATARARTPMTVMRRHRYDAGARAEGRDWPLEAETMVGMKRLDHLEASIRTVVREGIPGDLIETGVWRGGAVILMRAVLEALGERERRVWAADSFEGLPPPDVARFPADEGWNLYEFEVLAVGLDEVKANFARYGLLDDRVRFLRGWFKDTLPGAPIERLSLLRLDGDLYESTWQALDALYPKLSLGGFAVVDDYGEIDACRKAVDEWRARHGSTEPLERIDGSGVAWRRAR